MNLSFRLRERLARAIAEAERDHRAGRRGATVGSRSLDLAHEEVLRLMRNDAFPRFVHSAEYARYVGNYSGGFCEEQSENPIVVAPTAERDEPALLHEPSSHL